MQTTIKHNCGHTEPFELTNNIFVRLLRESAIRRPCANCARVQRGVIRHGTVQAVRRHHTTSVLRDVTLQWELIRHTEGHLVGELWLHLRGGVTGYESASLEDLRRHFPPEHPEGWHACVGTPGHWDELTVPTAEVLRLLEECRDA